MRKCQRTDKILIILIILSIGISFSLIAEMNSIHQSIPVNNTIYQCGYTEKNVLINLDDSIITSRMFSYPYIGVKINAKDYFFLNKQIAMFPYNDTMFGFNQSKYYSLILKEFRKTKNEYNLSDDQYVQYIVNFAQSMPYYEEPSNSTKGFPIVTFVNGCGNCVDKSLFSAAILSQENFNVSVFDIPSANHEMVGIASDCPNYIQKGGYAAIETTVKVPIGSPVTAISHFNDSSTRILRNGIGTKTFKGC